MTPRWQIPLGITLLVAAVHIGSSLQVDRQPAPQLALPCRVLRVHDGDTVTVQVQMNVSVRLLDCWAPELREAGGQQAKAKLQTIAEGRDALLIVPLGKSLSDSLSFGRVLARLLVEGQDASQAMVQAGFAAKTKPKGRQP
jgi:endonuclease YncB( thermonuclease family)